MKTKPVMLEDYDKENCKDLASWAPNDLDASLVSKYILTSKENIGAADFLNSLICDRCIEALHCFEGGAMGVDSDDVSGGCSRAENHRLCQAQWGGHPPGYRAAPTGQYRLLQEDRMQTLRAGKRLPAKGKDWQNLSSHV